MVSTVRLEILFADNNVKPLHFETALAASDALEKSGYLWHISSANIGLLDILLCTLSAAILRQESSILELK
jgi:hypothetical protein